MGIRHTHAGAKHCSGQLAKPKGNLPEPVRAAGRKPVDVAYTDQHEARTGGAWAGLADRRYYWTGHRQFPGAGKHHRHCISVLATDFAVFLSVYCIYDIWTQQCSLCFSPYVDRLLSHHTEYPLLVAPVTSPL